MQHPIELNFERISDLLTPILLKKNVLKQQEEADQHHKEKQAELAQAETALANSKITSENKLTELLQKEQALNIAELQKKVHLEKIDFEKRIKQAAQNIKNIEAHITIGTQELATAADKQAKQDEINTLELQKIEAETALELLKQKQANPTTSQQELQQKQEQQKQINAERQKIQDELTKLQKEVETQTAQEKTRKEELDKANAELVKVNALALPTEQKERKDFFTTFFANPDNKDLKKLIENDEITKKLELEKKAYETAKKNTDKANKDKLKTAQAETLAEIAKAKITQDEKNRIEEQIQTAHLRQLDDLDALRIAAFRKTQEDKSANQDPEIYATAEQGYKLPSDAELDDAARKVKNGEGGVTYDNSNPNQPRFIFKSIPLLSSFGIHIVPTETILQGIKDLASANVKTVALNGWDLDNDFREKFVEAFNYPFEHVYLGPRAVPKGHIKPPALNARTKKIQDIFDIKRDQKLNSEAALYKALGERTDGKELQQIYLNALWPINAVKLWNGLPDDKSKQQILQLMTDSPIQGSSHAYLTRMAEKMTQLERKALAEAMLQQYQDDSVKNHGYFFDAVVPFMDQKDKDELYQNIQEEIARRESSTNPKIKNSAATHYLKQTLQLFPEQLKQAQKKEINELAANWDTVDKDKFFKRKLSPEFLTQIREAMPDESQKIKFARELFAGLSKPEQLLKPVFGAFADPLEIYQAIKTDIETQKTSDPQKAATLEKSLPKLFPKEVAYEKTQKKTEAKNAKKETKTDDTPSRATQFLERISNAFSKKTAAKAAEQVTEIKTQPNIQKEKSLSKEEIAKRKVALWENEETRAQFSEELKDFGLNPKDSPETKQKVQAVSELYTASFLAKMCSLIPSENRKAFAETLINNIPIEKQASLLKEVIKQTPQNQHKGLYDLVKEKIKEKIMSRTDQEALDAQLLSTNHPAQLVRFAYLGTYTLSNLFPNQYKEEFESKKEPQANNILRPGHEYNLFDIPENSILSDESKPSAKSSFFDRFSSVKLSPLQFIRDLFKSETKKEEDNNSNSLNL